MEQAEPLPANGTTALKNTQDIIHHKYGDISLGYFIFFFQSHLYLLFSLLQIFLEASLNSLFSTSFNQVGIFFI